jgi:hypothetical protein
MIDLSGGGNTINEVLTTHTSGKADMNVQSDGTGGATFTVLSTNTATSSHATFDILATPIGSSTSSGPAVADLQSLHSTVTIDTHADTDKQSHISFLTTDQDKFVLGREGLSLTQLTRTAAATSATDYAGSMSVTVNGRECQRWDSQYPHTHGYSSTGSHNFCRDPSGSGSLWCYTTDPSQATENCEAAMSSKILLRLDASANMASSGKLIAGQSSHVAAKNVLHLCQGQMIRQDSHCYVYQSSSLDFGGASSRCNELGATLTTLNDFAEYGAVRNFVNSITGTTDTTTYWIGYTDQETVSTTRDGVPANVYGTWRWLSGQVSSLTLASAFTSWRANQETGRSSHFMKEVAANLPTVQSSIADMLDGEGNAEDRPSSMAVDGNQETASHTNGDASSPWWRVDLGTDTVATRYVTITAPNWVGNMEVWVGNLVSTSAESGSDSGWSDSGLYRCGITATRPKSSGWLASDDTIHCHRLGPNSQARYVYITVPATANDDSKFLSLVNVQVFATTDGHYEALDTGIPQCMTVKNGNLQARPCTEQHSFLCEQAGVSPRTPVA